MPLPMPSGRTRRTLTAAALAAAVVLTAGGCADFSEQDQTRNAGPFSSLPEFEAPRERPTPA